MQQSDSASKCSSILLSRQHFACGMISSCGIIRRFTQIIHSLRSLCFSSSFSGAESLAWGTTSMMTFTGGILGQTVGILEPHDSFGCSTASGSCDYRPANCKKCFTFLEENMCNDQCCFAQSHLMDMLHKSLKRGKFSCSMMCWLIFLLVLRHQKIKR